MFIHCPWPASRHLRQDTGDKPNATTRTNTHTNRQLDNCMMTKIRKKIFTATNINYQQLLIRSALEQFSSKSKGHGGAGPPSPS